MRYDTFIEFTNSTERDFIGVWNREYYEIKSGDTEIFPIWLARHFAKRLADDEMIKQHGKPLRDNDPRRKEFILSCMNLVDPQMKAELQKMSMKQQIEEDRKSLIQQGKIDPDAQGGKDADDLRKEILGEDYDRIVKEEKEGKKPKLDVAKPKKDKEKDAEVEFEGKSSDASKSLKEAIDKK